MLKRFGTKGFKSLADVEPLELGALTLVFGPNAVGKSNLLDALQVLSRLATTPTAADALEAPVRGLPLENLTFPPEGLPGLIETARTTSAKPSFSIDSEVWLPPNTRARYAVEIAIAPLSGAISVDYELLQRLSRAGTPQGKAVIETSTDRKTRIRRRSKPGHPWEEAVGQNHTHLSNRRYSGPEYPLVEAVRRELASFRSYYLDPRDAMREARAPQEVDDIGARGENIAPFLYRLKGEKPRIFDSVRRTMRTIIPSVEDVTVDLDARRGVLGIEIRQNGTPFSSRIVSEGTLRVLGLICVAINPWSGSLIAFEEPENGVHPRRIELIANLFASLSQRGRSGRQVILTTHSPIFCSSVLRMAKEQTGEIVLYRAVQSGRFSRFIRFDPLGPLFTDVEIKEGLSTPDEERVFEELQLRGFFDAP